MLVKTKHRLLGKLELVRLMNIHYKQLVKVQSSHTHLTNFCGLFCEITKHCIKTTVELHKVRQTLMVAQIQECLIEFMTSS